MCGMHSKKSRTEAIHLIFQAGRNQYHLVKLDLSTPKYGHNIATAIKEGYRLYHGTKFHWRGFVRIRQIEYVEVRLDQALLCAWDYETHRLSVRRLL